MSLVNKVIRDLSARSAAPDAVAGVAVQAVAEPSNSHEGFWRVMVALMLIAIGGVAYLAYELRPRAPIATELAYQYAKGAIEQARTEDRPPAAPAETAPAPAAAQVQSVEPRPAAQPASGPLKLARSIETPIAAASGAVLPPQLQARLPEPPRPSLGGAGTLDPREQARLHHLLGNVLASLSRHEEAVSAYKSALDGAPQNGAIWLGLAVSLEALGRRPDAVEAYGRALRTGSLERDEKAFAEQRLAQLR